MISQITGILISKTPTEAIIDCSGVGFHINISINTSDTLPNIGNKTGLYTLLIHREDTMQLYGFADKMERELFVQLISIPGIGPKSALSILSSITVPDLKFAISKGNFLLLQKLPGIGKKTAERIIIELKDKIKKINIDSTFISELQTDIINDATEVLITLGYNRVVAEKSVRKAIDFNKDVKNISIENLVKDALIFALK